MQIVSLYCDALIALRHIPIHSDTLYALARFLSSTFGRIVSPGNGPVAFHEFWKEVQPSLKHLDDGYPEELKTALCACHEAFGMSLPSGVSIETESQTDSQAARNTLLVRSFIVSAESAAQTHTSSRPPVSSELPQNMWRALSRERKPIHGHHSRSSAVMRCLQGVCRRPGSHTRPGFPLHPSLIHAVLMGSRTQCLPHPHDGILTPAAARTTCQVRRQTQCEQDGSQRGRPAASRTNGLRRRLIGP